MPTPTISPPKETPSTSLGFGPRPSFSARARTSRRGTDATPRDARLVAESVVFARVMTLGPDETDATARERRARRAVRDATARVEGANDAVEARQCMFAANARRVVRMHGDGERVLSMTHASRSQSTCADDAGTRKRRVSRATPYPSHTAPRASEVMSTTLRASLAPRASRDRRPFGAARPSARRAVAGIPRAAVGADDASTPLGDVVKDRQSLRFRDARTGVDVVLVGTMHYNPASIELASSTVASLRDADELASVVLETCPTRWAKTLKMQPPGTFMRTLLDNEFQAATDAAAPDTPVVLGDQRIEDLAASAKAVLKSTWSDFASPLGGGWTRLWNDWRDGYAREVGGIPGAGLGFEDLATDPRLIASTPVSLFRYPLAWSIKSPKVIVPFFTFSWGLARLPDVVPVGAVDAATQRYVASGPEQAVSALFLLLDILEVVFLSRLFLKALLETRNDVLARSVRRACEDAAEEAKGGDASAVVAILGAAHLNGVQLRLMGAEGAGEWEREPSEET